MPWLIPGGGYSLAVDYTWTDDSFPADGPYTYLNAEGNTLTISTALDADGNIVKSTGAQFRNGVPNDFSGDESGDGALAKYAPLGETIVSDGCGISFEWEASDFASTGALTLGTGSKLSIGDAGRLKVTKQDGTGRAMSMGAGSEISLSGTAELFMGTYTTQGASHPFSKVEASTVKDGVAPVSALVRNTSVEKTEHLFSGDDADILVKDATVTISGQYNIAISAQCDNVSLYNSTQGKNILFTHAGNTYGSMTAVSGDIEVQNAGSALALDTLELGEIGELVDRSPRTFTARQGGEGSAVSTVVLRAYEDTNFQERPTSGLINHGGGRLDANLELGLREEVAAGKHVNAWLFAADAEGHYGLDMMGHTVTINACIDLIDFAGYNYSEASDGATAKVPDETYITLFQNVGELKLWDGKDGYLSFTDKYFGTEAMVEAHRFFSSDSEVYDWTLGTSYHSSIFSPLEEYNEETGERTVSGWFVTYQDTGDGVGAVSLVFDTFVFVPEPATSVLSVAALALLCARRRRRA